MKMISNVEIFSIALLSTLSACDAKALMTKKSKVLEIGTASGQIPGSRNGQRVCIYKFDSNEYKVSPRVGDSCVGAAEWVPKNEVSYTTEAFGAWLTEIQPGGMIKLNLKYASDKIFPVGDGSYRITKPLYGQGRCFLHPNAKSKITQAEAILSKKYPAYRLMLLDCYRPMYVSGIMWDLIQDPIWVAASGKSGHNKGGAIDLTLATLNGSTPVEVDMGSEFDLFSSRSEFGAPGLSAQQRKARFILREVMVEAGFNPYEAEWWHFSTEAHSEYLALPL